jgi:hypothetical protein
MMRTVGRPCSGDTCRVVDLGRSCRVRRLLVGGPPVAAGYWETGHNGAGIPDRPRRHPLGTGQAT